MAEPALRPTDVDPREFIRRSAVPFAELGKYPRGRLRPRQQARRHRPGRPETNGPRRLRVHDDGDAQSVPGLRTHPQAVHISRAPSFGRPTPTMDGSLPDPLSCLRSALGWPRLSSEEFIILTSGVRHATRRCGRSSGARRNNDSRLCRRAFRMPSGTLRLSLSNLGRQAKDRMGGLAVAAAPDKPGPR
jgi:hypothetical protein